MNSKTIAVFFGGCSTEHEVSLQSAQAVLNAIDRERYLPLAVANGGCSPAARNSCQTAAGSGILPVFPACSLPTAPVRGFCCRGRRRAVFLSPRAFPFSTERTAKTGRYRDCWNCPESPLWDAAHWPARSGWTRTGRTGWPLSRECPHQKERYSGTAAIRWKLSGPRMRSVGRCLLSRCVPALPSASAG